MTKSTKPMSAKAVLAQVMNKRQPSQRTQQRLAELERLDAERKAMKKRWFGDLVSYAKRFERLKKSYRKELYEILQSVYALYLEVRDNTGIAEDFYRELRDKLTNSGYKLQKNTRDAGLLVRCVLGASKSTSSLQQYVAAIYYAVQQEVKPSEFSQWLEKERLAAIAKASAKAVQDPEVKRQRLRRARTLILQYMEYRETKPFASHKMFAWNAERYLGESTDLCVMIGIAVRRFDRESDYADIHITHILPPNIELDITIVDRWAKFIEPKLEQFEQEFATMNDDAWSEEFSAKLWEFDVREAEKKAQYWQLRQQAALAEDQQEFTRKSEK